MSASVSQGRQHEGTGTPRQEQGGPLMPVRGARVGPGHPAGQPAPWEASWAYSDARKLGAAPALPPPCPRPCPFPQPGPCPASARPRLCTGFFGDQPSPPCRNRGGPRSRGASTSALALPSTALGCGSALELPGTLWHCAGMQLSLLYMSPSAFKTRFCDLPIHYVKSSKIRNRFQPRNSVNERFSSPFFFTF